MTLHSGLAGCSHFTGEDGVSKGQASGLVQREQTAPQEWGEKDLQNFPGGGPGDRTWACPLDKPYTQFQCPQQAATWDTGPPVRPAFSLPPHSWVLDLSTKHQSFGFEHGLGAEAEIAVAIGLAAGQKLGPLPTHSQSLLNSAGKRNM